MDIEKLTEEINAYCKKTLSEKRYSHSLRVADMCCEIAELSGYDKKRLILQVLLMTSVKNFQNLK